IRNHKVTPCQKLVGAERQRKSNENHRRQVQPSSRRDREEAGEHEQIQRQIEVTLDGLGHGGLCPGNAGPGDPARIDGGFRHGKLLLLAKPAQKGSACGNSDLAPNQMLAAVSASSGPRVSQTAVSQIPVSQISKMDSTWVSLNTSRTGSVGLSSLRYIPEACSDTKSPIPAASMASTWVRSRI